MSLRRIGVLLSKEFIQGPKNFIFVYAIVLPVVMSLVLSAIFGTLFSETPKLGVTDEGSSQLTVSLAGLDVLVPVLEVAIEPAADRLEVARAFATAMK